MEQTFENPRIDLDSEEVAEREARVNESDTCICGALQRFGQRNKADVAARCPEHGRSRYHYAANTVIREVDAPPDETES